jgi:hypothetical protein
VPRRESVAIPGSAPKHPADKAGSCRIPDLEGRYLIVGAYVNLRVALQTGMDTPLMGRHGGVQIIRLCNGRAAAGVSEVIEDQGDLGQVLRASIFRGNTVRLNMRLPPAMNAVLSKLGRQRMTTRQCLLAERWNRS